MRAELKNIYCYDAELEFIQIDEDGCVGVELVLEIGATDSDACDTFNVFVCSAAYLDLYSSQPRLLMNTILVKDFDIKQIKQLIENYLMHCSGNNWQEISLKISKAFS